MYITVHVHHSTCTSQYMYMQYMYFLKLCATRTVPHISKKILNNYDSNTRPSGIGTRIYMYMYVCQQ